MSGFKSKDVKKKLSELFARFSKSKKEKLRQIADGPDANGLPMEVISIDKLHPTQIAVGMIQVEHKQERIRALENKPNDLLEYITQHPIRVVKGPEDQVYVIDHHHLALALLRENYAEAPMMIEADYSHMKTSAAFWRKMREMHYVYPYDENGKKCPYHTIPAKLTDLKDDPYRSLAGFTREAGGFDKVMTPFVEFGWANYFRDKISKKQITENFKKAVKAAVALAGLPGAKDLPGYKPAPAPKADAPKPKK